MSELEKRIGGQVLHRRTSVEIKRGGDELGKGLTEGTVRRVAVTILGDKGKTRHTHLAEKIFDHPQLTSEAKKDAIDEILKIHAELKALGFPTISTMRTEFGNDSSILMTDLTEKGANEVVSVPDWSGGPERSGKFYQTDRKVEISNAEQLSQSFASLFEQTIEKGCAVAYPDAFFMIINKASKEGRIIFGDLLEISFVSLPEDPNVRELFMENNFEVFRSFILDMLKHTQAQPPLSMRPLRETRKKYLNKYKAMRSGR